MSRIIIVGGPRNGKSTLARSLGLPHYCGDPLSKVKEPLNNVTYLPEGIDMYGDSGGGEWVWRNWFPLPGPWVFEGHVMARALRRWMRFAPESANRMAYPCDKIIVLRRPHPKAVITEGQERMGRAVMTVWDEIEWRFRAISEER